MPASNAFVQALVDIADEQGSDAQLVLMRDDAIAKIAAGGGEVGFLTSASINGKTGQQQMVMDAQTLLSAVSAALRIYRGQSVCVTYPDFSSLS